MITAIDTKISLDKHKLFVIKGDDAQLRFDTITLFGAPSKVLDAGMVATSDLVRLVGSKTVDDKVGYIKIINAEKLVVDNDFDYWLHLRTKNKLVVLVVSPGEKLLVHYSRVVGRRGLIISCDLPVGDLRPVKEWVRNRAAHKRIPISSAIVAELVTRCESLMAIDTALDMLKYGWHGHAITMESIDALVIGSSGPNLMAEYLFDGNLKCVPTFLRCLIWGETSISMVRLLISNILIRIRLREAGSTAKEAAQKLGFDPRRAVKWFEQARVVGIDRLWLALKELSAISSTEEITEVRLIHWLLKTCPTYIVK